MALFSGELGQSFWRKLNDVQANDGYLRLRIVTSVERWQHLPWELLYDPSRGDFLSLSGRLALVRTRADGIGKGDSTEFAPLTKLRILAAEADVPGGLETAGDFEILRGLAAQHSDYVEVEYLAKASSETLKNALHNGSFDIFHFAGSGKVLGPTKRDGIEQSLLLWENESSQEPLDRHDLGDWLKESGVRLAIFNACHTDWVARSLARFIPAVVGFRESVGIAGCHTACASLYSNIFSRTPLDQVVTAARQALDRESPGTGDWCKLIFYQQTRTGDILLDPQFPFLMRTATISGAASKAQPQLRLLEVYQRNLAAAQRSPTIPESQVIELRAKVDKIRRELEM
jgi:hypothetical protein